MPSKLQGVKGALKVSKMTVIKITATAVVIAERSQCLKAALAFLPFLQQGPQVPRVWNLASGQLSSSSSF